MSSNLKEQPPFPLDWQVKKHVALIHASGALTKIEKLLVNILLYNAYDDLSSKRMHTIPSKFLFNLLGWHGSNNLAGIKKSLKLLGSRIVEFNILEDGEEDWGFDHFISYGRIKNGICYYKYNEEMAELLYEPEVYAMIRASLEYELSGTYSINLYENCVRFKNTKNKTTGWWDLERFRLLMGATAPLYNDFKYLKREIINKPIADINKNTDIDLSVAYETKGRKVLAVKFFIESKENSNRIFKDEDLDQHADIINGETYKRLIAAGLGRKLSLMYVLKDEARAKAILNNTENDVKTGKIRKPGVYIKTVLESDSLIIDVKELEREKEEKRLAEEKAKREAEAIEEQKNNAKRSEVEQKMALFDALHDDEKAVILEEYRSSLNDIVRTSFDKWGHQHASQRALFVRYLEKTSRV